MRYAYLVMGPAGSGKSTLVSSLVNHGIVSKRRIHAVNLDPAAEFFDYDPLVDVKDFIQLEDAMEDEELKFGPNGGLVFCLEYLIENTEWLEEQLGEVDQDYIVFDCPGQIELYTHMNVMRKLVETLQSWNFRVGALYLLDANFMIDGSKFISGSVSALSVMINLEVAHINVLSKLDLLSSSSRKQLDRFLDPDTRELAGIEDSTRAFGPKYQRLSAALGRVLEDYSLVRYYPLNITDEESVGDLVITMDNILQFGEDEEVKTKDFDGHEQDDDQFADTQDYTT